MQLENFDERYIDVPLSLAHGTRQMPLGRYLRRKLRMLTGRPENTPTLCLDQQKAELQPMREAAKVSLPKALHRIPGLLETQTREEIIKSSEGRRIQINAREHRNRRKNI